MVTTESTAYVEQSVPTGYKYYFLSCTAIGVRPLATTLIDVEQAKRCTSESSAIVAMFAGDTTSYEANVYFSSNLTKVYIKSKSGWDAATLYGVR